MAEDDSLQIFDPLMKKKKKKKKAPFDPNAAFADGEAADDGQAAETEEKEEQQEKEKENKDDDDFTFAGDDFPGLKKKKKKKTFNLDDIEKALPEGDKERDDDRLGEQDGDGDRGDGMGEGDLDLTLPMKKKKKKKAFNIDELTSETTGQRDDFDDDDVIMEDAPKQKGSSWVGTDRDYTYEELLSRVFDIMRERNPDMVAGEKRRFVMRPPQVLRVGTKKTSFANFTEICKMLHRQPKHLLAFLLAELGTSGSVDGNSQLIIKGRFQQKQIETVLRRYIKEYVTCHTCRSPDTILQRDTRIFFLQCESCGSRCSVASIKAGFQAVTGKRAAIRAKNN